MLKTGYELSDEEIGRRYSSIVKQVSMPRYFYGYIAELVAGQPAGDTVLDLGCGNGYLLEAIARRRPDLTLCGVEAAPGLVASATTRSNGRWRVLQGTALEIPFDAASFELVTMTEVFEHMKDPRAVLREVARVLRPAGRLLLTVPNMSAYGPFWRVAERMPMRGLRDAFLPWEHPLKTFQPIDTAYEFDEIREIIRAAGFRVDTMAGREFLPYVTTTIPLARRLYAKVAQRGADDALSHVLPVRMAYRLVIQCHPS